MWWRSLIIALAVLAASCQVRPLYLDTAATGGAVSPTEDLRAIAIDQPRDRVQQVLRNELLFLFNGQGGGNTSDKYRLRILSTFSTNDLAVELEEDLPAAVLVTLAVTFILSERETDETLLTGTSTSTASYDFSSQRFANVRAERNALDRAATSNAEMINARIAAYFAARRGS